MKKKTVEYDYPKATNYLAAAIEVNGHYLILRNANDEVFNKYGYFFPGCREHKDFEQALYLKEQLQLKYRFNVNVANFVGDVLVKDRAGRYSCLYLYKCTLNANIRSTIIEVNGDKFKVEFFKPEEFKKLNFDTADGFLAQRINVFKRIMNVSFEKITRTKDENEQALNMYDCLLFFHGKVAKKDIIDFLTLVRTNASLDEIKTAYDWIIKRSKVDVKEYIKYIAKRDAKKRK